MSSLRTAVAIVAAIAGADAIPSIVYVDDTNPTVINSAPYYGPAITNVLENDILLNGEPGDYLQIDEVWFVSGSGQPWDTGFCRSSGNSIVFTPAAGFSGGAICQYTAKVVRPGGRNPAFTEINGPGTNYIAVLPPPPTRRPTRHPTKPPTNKPTKSPTDEPTVSPSLSPTISPTMYPTLEPTLYPTLEPTLEPEPVLPPPPPPPTTPRPTREPTPDPTPEPTPEPTPVPPPGQPVLNDVAAVVCTGKTTVIGGVLDGAVPGPPAPNSVDLVGIVLQGIPSRRSLRLRSIDGARCALGYAAGSIQYIGNTYVGPYECVFEAADERGLTAEGTLVLDVRDCTAGERQASSGIVPAEFILTPGPTPGPTSEPTPGPTRDPTPGPTPGPTPDPTPKPTPAPTPGPTDVPTDSLSEPEPELEEQPETEPEPDPEPEEQPETEPEPELEETPEPEQPEPEEPEPEERSSDDGHAETEPAPEPEDDEPQAPAVPEVALRSGENEVVEDGDAALNEDELGQSVAKSLENGSSRSGSLTIGAAFAFLVGALACL